MGMRVGVDIGGTFIDFCLWDEAKEELHSLKVLTTPQTPGAELLRGLDLLQERHGVEPSDITSFVHGTTVGINTVIQRKGASLALLTTENFEDVIELARLRMPETYSLFSRRGAPLMPRDRVFGIRERMLADGTVEQAARRGVRRDGGREGPGQGRRRHRHLAAPRLPQSGARGAQVRGDRRARRAASCSSSARARSGRSSASTSARRRR